MNIDLKRRICFVIINIFAISLLLLIIIFVPIFCEVMLDGDKALIDENASNIIMSVLFPLLGSVISFLVANYRTPFKIFSKNDALGQIEQQLGYGVINIEKYRENTLFIEKFDLEKKKMRAEIEIEKMKIKNAIQKQTELEIKKMNEANKKSEIKGD